MSTLSTTTRQTKGANVPTCWGLFRRRRGAVRHLFRSNVVGDCWLHHQVSPGLSPTVQKQIDHSIISDRARAPWFLCLLDSCQQLVKIWGYFSKLHIWIRKGGEIVLTFAVFCVW